MPSLPLFITVLFYERDTIVEMLYIQDIKRERWALDHYYRELLQKCTAF